MQLLRVTSTMSYQGSPYSGPGDDYDFEDDGYDDLDEYRDQEDPLPPPPVDDSDEDTEEASETDIPNNDEPVEIKEQMYQDKLVNLKKQLQQLEDGVHPEFLRRVKRLEHQLHERLRLNKIYKDHMHDVVEREYISEKKAAAKEFEEKPHHNNQPRKHHNSTSSTCAGESPVREGDAGGGGGGGAGAEARVEDGKLWYERRWFHRGQSVYVEARGREIGRFAGHIHAITDEAIWVKKTNLERVRIYVSQLARGKVTLKRRAS
ncbi:PREDICTED: sin3 histone deacetylase corepressor complex component SDS3 [Papilio polytes]|uniref:sin3 histone deacetylase corepressor complex component SDS3 n=1 Tax=Papilio polytes TaxID=76194 RepID=UPI0006765B25|nr:PREDICTED: sin3 histone deacetylase corepressor complex component SDS3 [Papilio polytes]